MIHGTTTAMRPWPRSRDVRLPFAALALLLLAAGCLSPSTSAPGEDPMAGYTSPDDPIPVEGEGGEHDHRDPAQHRFARAARLTDWDDLRRFGWHNETVVGAHALAMAGPARDLLVVGVNAGETDDGQQGFHLFDASVPGQLEHVSYYHSPQPVGGDRTVAVSDDGNLVFLGYEGVPRPGVAAVDISDPADPHEVAFWADPQDYGSHTVAAGVVDGVQYVFSLAVGVNILRYQDGVFTLVGKYVTADQLTVAEAAGIALGDQGTGAGQTYAFRALYGHDMTFFPDPVTGKPLLFVAYAYDGFKVVDLSQPSVPVTIARWLPPSDSTERPYTHSVAAERLPSGELLVVVGAETFEPPNQGVASPLWVLDATDAVAAPPLTVEPTYLATWRNPGGAPAGNLGLSVHFFRLQDGILYTSHYHGGVWAVDLRTPEAQRHPAELGYLMPIPPGAIEPPEDCCIGFDLDGAPMVFDVEVNGGTVYAADIIQGVTAMQFDAVTGS